MILACLNGDLISVKLTKKLPVSTIVRDDEGREYCYRESDFTRKLFDGKNAVYDGIAWIEQQNGITIHGIN